MITKLLTRLCFLFALAFVVLPAVTAHAAPPTTALVYSGSCSVKNIIGNSYFSDFEPGTVRVFFVVHRTLGESRTIFYGKNRSGDKTAVSTTGSTLTVHTIGAWPSSFMAFSGNTVAFDYYALQYARGKVSADVPLNLSGGTANVPKKVTFLYHDISSVNSVLGESKSIGTLQLDLTRSQNNNENYNDISATVTALRDELISKGYSFAP